MATSLCREYCLPVGVRRGMVVSLNASLNRSTPQFEDYPLRPRRKQESCCAGESWERAGNCLQLADLVSGARYTGSGCLGIKE